MHSKYDEHQTFEKFSRRHTASSKRRWELDERRGEAQLRAGFAGCWKIPFASKSDAQTAMLRYNSKNLPKQIRSTYRCPSCQAWHLTSQKQRMWKTAS